MSRLLVLRPEPGASATVKRARELGIDAFSVPLFEVEPVDWKVPEPGGFDGLLLTSANAIRKSDEKWQRLRALKVYAVGEATAVAATEAGFEIAAIGELGIDALLASMPPDLKLLHLCGVDRRPPQGTRQLITPVVVYRSKQIERHDLASALDCVALIHSPRAGSRFGELVRERRTISVVAISAAAGEAVGNGWREVAVAERPSDEALLALAARLCNNSHPE